MANEGRIETIERVVFERLVSGARPDELRAELSKEFTEDDMERLIAPAIQRIEEGRESKEFRKLVLKIRRRRLVGHRYLPWKVLAGVFLVPAAIYSVLGVFIYGLSAVQFFPLVGAGVFFAVVEWRQHKRIHFDNDWLEASQEQPET